MDLRAAKAPALSVNLSQKSFLCKWRQRGHRTKNAACCADCRAQCDCDFGLHKYNWFDLICSLMKACVWQSVLKSFPDRLLVLLRLMKPGTSSCSMEETWKLLPRTDCSGDDTAFYCAERLDYLMSKTPWKKLHLLGVLSYIIQILSRNKQIVQMEEQCKVLKFQLSEVEKALTCCFVISIIKLSATGFNEKPWLNISEPLEQLSGNNLSQTEDIYK